MDSLISKLVNTLTGDKVAQQGKDYWVDDAKCKACYECETPFSVFVRRHHCRICGRIFCSSCTFNSIPASGDVAVPASGEQAWLRMCNYCHRMRQRDDDGSERQQSDTAGQLLLGATHTPSSSRPRADELGVVTSSSGSIRTGNSSPSGKLQHALSQRSNSSSSGSDGSLTWEVPPVLERVFGPTAEAVAEEVTAPADDNDAAAPAAAPGAAVSRDGEAAAASTSSSGPLSPSSQPLSSTSGLHPVVLLNRQEFARAADEHLQQLLWQLLQAEEVQQPDMWLPIVQRLVCEASRALLPAAAAAFGEQDPRFYVKVKRLPDMGSPADCRVVRGVVAKKNVAHRRMRTDISQPAVVLLSGALEYQRVANRLSSFDTLLEQEREHLRLAVARIAACKPDLLLVERSVARSAQEELLQRGIALVQHTKPELLERLGRCMGVKVAASLEELSPQLVGSCSRFKVEQLPGTPVVIQQQQQAAAANCSAVDDALHQLTASAGAAQAQSASSFSSSNSLTAAIALGDAGSAAPAPVASAAAAAAGAKPAPVSATPAPAKTLMLFDGCPLPLGCTVLLWGASAAELTKLKRIVRFGVLAAYHQGLECSFLAEELALATAALATPDISRDAALYCSLARAAISSSREATNPCGLQSERRLLLSLSPHVVVPDALEKEQQHERALLAQQQREEAMQHQQQQQHAQLAELPESSEQQEQQLGAAPASLQQPAVAAVTPTSPVADDQQQEQLQEAAGADEADAEPEFTDPLRRRTFPGEGPLLSDEEEEQQQQAVVLADDAAELAPARVQPLWLQGMQLYDRQHIYLSMACCNPRRGLMCEPPAIKRIDFYCHSDLSLAGFIVAAAPHAQKKCQVAGCGYGVTCHVRTFLHGCSRITLSIATLPSSDALPGEERGQVWTWLRPKGVRHQGSNCKQVRRLPLSQATACLSFGMFLSLCSSAPGLEAFGSPLHASFVRYFGLGRTVMCLHQDGIHPSAVAMPRIRVSYSLNAQLMWLKQEAAELCQESNEAFDVLESALQSHPYFKTQAAAAAASAAASPLSAGQQQQHSPSSALDVTPAAAAAYTAVADGSGSSTPNSAMLDGPMSAETDAAAGNGGSSSSGSLLVSMAAMLSAVRKDRISFMDKVAEAVQRATPETPTRESAGGMMWDEQLMSGVQELNRLRRSLAITSLTWAAALQEPSFFAQMLAASSSAAVTAAVAAAAAAAAPPGSPMAVAVAAAAAAAAAAGLAAGGESNSGSTHGGSMFHLPPAVAAQRMGISDGQEGDPSGPALGVSVPIMPNMGPIAVQAVANLVAHEAATSTSGGLLEGSQSVMMAVTQRATEAAAAAASNGSSGCSSSAVTPGAADTPGEVPGGGASGRDAAAAAAAAAGAVALHSRSSSLGGGSLPSSPRAAAAAAVGSVGSPGKAAGQLLAAVGRRLTSSLSAGASSSRTIGTGQQPSSPSSASGGSSSYIAERGKQLSLQQHRTASGAGSSTAAAAAAAAAAAGSASGDDASSEDGEVAHDRFVAWMTSHEITNAYDTDDMSDYFPEQLPDWDEAGGAASAAGTSNSTAAAGAPQRLDGVASPLLQQRPPMSPGTPELPVRAASGASGAADDAGTSSSTAAGVLLSPRRQLSSHARARSVETAVTAGLGGVVGTTAAVAAAGVHRRAESAELAGAASHQRTGSVDAASFDNSRQQQQQGSGIPAGLPAIRTGGGGSSGSAGAARSGGASSSAAVAAGLGLQQIARVALPGRALMPAGINDTVVPIFDGEPTSIAAYYLSSRPYQLQLNAAMRQILHDDAMRRPTGQQQQQQGRQQQQAAGSSGGNDGMAAASAAAAVAHHSRSASQETFSNSRGYAESAAGAAAEGAAAAAAEQLAAAAAALAQEQRGTAGNSTAATAPAEGSNSNATQASALQQQLQQQQQQQRRSQVQGISSAPSSSQQQRQPDWLALLLSPEPLHVKHAFEDESPGIPWLRARFSVTAYFAPQFAELRRRCIAGGEAAYITSLCRCRKWASRGGKSNAYFAKTRDDRFIVKSLSKPEKASFLEFAPAYFEHMARAAASGTPTTLAKVAGVYSITIRTQGGAPAAAAPGPGGQSGPFRDGSIDVLVMENIFYDRQISRIYDLKGSERSRFNADAAANPQDAGAVHLDDNLRRSNLQAPLLVEQGLLRSMEHALWRDTSFLAGLGVMDYSLLVGVDREHNTLVVAIIDFIRTYTWDKQLETWVKASGILGGSGKEPTIVSPKQYMRRFRAAISSYFTVVPDGHEVEPPLDPEAA